MNPAISRKRRHEAAYARQRESQDSCETSGCDVNVGPTERWLSMFGGGVLVACGLLRGSASGLAIATLGAGLAYRGYTGHCHLYDALGKNTATTGDTELGESAESAPIG